MAEKQQIRHAGALILADEEGSASPGPDTATAEQAEQAEQAWRPPKVRMGPAAIILGIVAVVSLGGFALAIFGSGHPQRSPALGKPDKSGLAAVAGASAISRIAAGDNPPADVIAAVVLPEDAMVSGTRDADKGVGPYDRSLVFKVPAPASAVVSFYQSELVHFGWKLAGLDATASGGQAVYATRPSADGYYWEIGAVVVPVSPAITPALAGGAAAPTSTLTLRLFEIDDAD